MENEFLFTKIEEKDVGNIQFQHDSATCHTAEATLVVLRSVFAVKDECYAEKPDTIVVLKDNIPEVLGELQLHTIDNVLKN